MCAPPKPVTAVPGDVGLKEAGGLEEKRAWERSYYLYYTGDLSNGSKLRDIRLGGITSG